MTPTHPSPASTAWLIRHGESVANAGGPVTSFSEIALTPRGHQQAEIFARRFDRISPHPPTRIVQSPYLRARQTAHPLICRFPDAPVETWPIHEFTYLDPDATQGLNETQRAPFYARYWDRDDPQFANPGAESFTHFLDRVREMLARLAALPRANVYPSSPTGTSCRRCASTCSFRI
ncbi:MAG: histidine phosphatase family protein [Acidobacteriota bacterium]|nr:histidine phosphatase family protein [Acidobacteriota bacterium]